LVCGIESSRYKEWCEAGCGKWVAQAYWVGQGKEKHAVYICEVCGREYTRKELLQNRGIGLRAEKIIEVTQNRL